MTTYKVTYFGLPGLAEPIRLAFVLSGTDFEDERIDRSEWAKRKETIPSPSGQVPLLTITSADGEVQYLSQSSAIINYVGKLTGFYPKDDDLKAALIDEVNSLVADIRAKFIPSLMMPDGEEKDALRKELASTIIPEWAGKLEKHLSKNTSGFAIGDSLTVADFVVYTLNTMLTSGWISGIPTTILEQYETIQKIVKSVEAHPKLAPYQAKHKQ